MAQAQRIEHATPRVQVVVGFHDIFPAIVQPAISQDEAETAVLKVVLMIAFDCIAHKRDADLVYWPPHEEPA